MYQQIILRKLEKPKAADTITDIDWICKSLGFGCGRDTERISAKIIKNLLEDVSQDGHSSAEELANELNIACQRVNYHLRALTEAGFLYRQRRLIFLRDGSVKAAIEEMRRDANRIFDRMAEIADEVDASLGLKSR